MENDGKNPNTEAQNTEKSNETSAEKNDMSPTQSVSRSIDSVERPQVDVNHLANVLFDKVSDYLQGELATTVEDYKLLEDMNRITITKYSDMKQIAGNVSKALQDLNEKYQSLQPYLDQIDQIEDNVLKLEQAAYKLDAYSKRLETKFKHLEKR